jgi:flagellar basal body-associated protein FliL
MTKKHLLLMLACCLIPIGLIVAIGALAIPTTGLVSTVIVLMCPLMMLFMMFGMRGSHEEHHEQHTAAPVDKKQIGASLDQ